jgi:hypothetical protein
MLCGDVGYGSGVIVAFVNAGIENNCKYEVYAIMLGMYSIINKKTAIIRNQKKTS